VQLILHSARFHFGILLDLATNPSEQPMRHVLYWIVSQLVVLSAAQAQATNDVTGVPHVFQYPLPRQTVVLEFNQDECQASVTEEYVIPDVPANPGNVALTMLFNSVCDLGPSTTGTVPLTQAAPREIIEELPVSPDGLRTSVKFNK
jgi:hypothetical protein